MNFSAIFIYALCQNERQLVQFYPNSKIDVYQKASKHVFWYQIGVLINNLTWFFIIGVFK